MTMLGPVANLSEDVLNLVYDNARSAMEGKETHFWEDAFRKGEHYVPMSNLWYTHLFTQRLMSDVVKNALFGREWGHRKERWKEEFTGSSYWWGPTGYKGPPGITR